MAILFLSLQDQQQEQHPRHLCVTALTPPQQLQSHHPFTASRPVAISLLPSTFPSSLGGDRLLSHLQPFLMLPCKQEQQIITIAVNASNRVPFSA